MYNIWHKPRNVPASADSIVREMLCDRLEGYDPVGLEKIKNDPSRILCLPCPQETVTFGLVYSKLPTVVNQKKKPLDQFEMLHREEFTRVVPPRLERQITSILEEMNPKISGMIKDSISLPDLRTVLEIPRSEGLLCGHLFPDLRHVGEKKGFALTDNGIYCRDTKLFFVSWWDMINGDIIIPTVGDCSLSFKDKGKSAVIACWEKCDIPRCGFMVFQLFLLIQENIWNIKKRTRSVAKKKYQEEKNAVSGT